MAVMEIVRPWEGMEIRYALFDFDGTISLIRQGWQDIMIPYFVEVLKETGTDESDEQLLTIVTDFVDTLTGKQKYQSYMIVVRYEAGSEIEAKLSTLNGYKLKNKTLSGAYNELVAEIKLTDTGLQDVALLPVFHGQTRIDQSVF